MQPPPGMLVRLRFTKFGWRMQGHRRNVKLHERGVMGTESVKLQRPKGKVQIIRGIGKR